VYAADGHLYGLYVDDVYSPGGTVARTSTEKVQRALTSPGTSEARSPTIAASGFSRKAVR